MYEAAAMLVYQTNPGGVELLCKHLVPINLQGLKKETNQVVYLGI